MKPPPESRESWTRRVHAALLALLALGIALWLARVYLFPPLRFRDLPAETP